jgi:alpha-1,2-mannosyltransferase
MRGPRAAENPGTMGALLEAGAVRPATGDARADRARLALEALALALLALFVWAYVARNLPLQWDLRAYLTAARAAWAGLDPYRPGDLRSLAGREVLPFVYPPVALLPFSALAGLPSATAAELWIGGKVALLGALLVAWKRWFVPGAGPLALGLTAVLGWNAAALTDLASGNVALVECALLWAAFACFVRGRRTAFALLVVAAGCFKLVPGVFLLLLLVPAGTAKPDPARCSAALAGLAALVGLPMLIGPASHWEPFWAHLPPSGTLMGANPSGLGLAMVAAQRAGLAEPLASRVALAAWAGFALGLIALSAPFLARLWRERDPRRWVMAAVCLVTLLAPRPMAYGYVLLAPAPLFFAPAPFRGRAGGLLLALVLSAQGLTRIAGHASGSPAFAFAPFLLTLCVWMLVLQAEARRPASDRPAPQEAARRVLGEGGAR